MFRERESGNDAYLESYLVSAYLGDNPQRGQQVGIEPTSSWESIPKRTDLLPTKLGLPLNSGIDLGQNQAQHPS